MGASASQNLEPDELVVFKKLPYGSPLDNINIPEREQYRVRTDTRFLIAFFTIVIILMPFLIYTLMYSDIERFNPGYDKCGNVCGKENTKYDDVACSGKDFTQEKYLEVRSGTAHRTGGWWASDRQCVRECSSGYAPFGHHCEKRESHLGIYAETEDELKIEKNVSNYLKKVAWRIVLCIALGLAVTLVMIFLFRTQTAAVVWGILGGSLIFGGIVIGTIWYYYFTIKEIGPEGNQAYLVPGIVLTIMWLVLLCVVIFLYRKILLVTQILKEATKAALAMPLLVFTPILSFLGILIVIFAAVTTTAYMASAGVLKEQANDNYHYEITPVMVFTIVFNICVVIWAVQFLLGIQYMVIAGAVSKWYFATNKNNLNGPISTSARIVMKFHLGTVAFGSMIITLIIIIRTIIQSLTKNRGVKAFVDCIIGPIERFLKFLTKNAYIITAMHGKPFYKSGKRAAKIIFQNAVNIASINYIGDFILCMAQVLIILITMLITYGILQGTDSQYEFLAYIIVFVSTAVIAFTFFAIFETTIDTIFICFCEDQLLNDGMARPYAMSRNLMEFVENAKKIYGEKKN